MSSLVAECQLYELLQVILRFDLNMTRLEVLNRLDRSSSAILERSLTESGEPSTALIVTL